ncbi:MAG: hypothetical protein IPG53_23080 [Ignavibacteriales bacterium]|nr:hypothetical protein [Ignavibacteriales bacterium]
MDSKVVNCLNGIVGIFPQTASIMMMLSYMLLMKKDAGFLLELHFLRQQAIKASGLPNHCPADFLTKRVGQKGLYRTFAVTAGIGVDDLVKHYESDNDDYSAIMVKALDSWAR